MPRSPTSLKKAPRLDRADWISAAREALIRGGEAGVRVDPLAAAMGVTTGSFYWHFKNRQELLSEVLIDWEATNSAAFVNAIENHEGDPDAQFEALAEMWIDEINFNPAYDAAIRDWARTAPKVDKLVRRVDDRRIALIHEIFVGYGYTGVEALVRARITYFHQIGYYALHIKESRNERRRLKPVYLRVLKGPPP